MAREIFIATPVITIISDIPIYAIKCPAKAWLTRFCSVSLDGSPGYNVKLFNRSFTLEDAIDVRGVTGGGGSYAVLETVQAMPFDVGDVITLSGGTPGTYDGDDRVVSKIDANHVMLGSNYTISTVGGSVNLAVPEAEQDLYKILDIDADGAVAEFDGPTWVPMISADPVPQGKAARDSSYIYFKPDQEASYRVSLTFLLPS